MSQNKLRVYVVADGPEDYWHGWVKLTELEKSISSSQVPIHDRPQEDGFDLRTILYQVLEATQSGAGELGWEGDIRGNCAFGFVAPAGYGCRPHVTVAFKQDNNGTCFYGSTDFNFHSSLTQWNTGSAMPMVIVDVETTISLRRAEV